MYNTKILGQFISAFLKIQFKCIWCYVSPPSIFIKEALLFMYHFILITFMPVVPLTGKKSINDRIDNIFHNVLKFNYFYKMLRWKNDYDNNPQNNDNKKKTHFLIFIINICCCKEYEISFSQLLLFFFSNFKYLSFKIIPFTFRSEALQSNFLLHVFEWKIKYSPVSK